MNGDCSAAIVGGVNVISSPDVSISLTSLMRSSNVPILDDAWT